MKSKGAIKFFAIALAVVCLFQLSFTIVTTVVENKADNFSQGDPAKRKQYLDSISHEPVYDLLVREYSYMECKERELNLGLDLQGGMHVTLEVSVDKLLRELSNNNQNETFQKALDMAEQKQKTRPDDYITLFYESFQEIDPDAQLAAIFATRANRDYISFNSTDEEVLDFLRKEVDDALTRTFNILRTRIDQYGVTQPNIQKEEGTGRIIVELPGVDDPDRVRRLLQVTAKLEFWETYESSEVLPYFKDVNEILRKQKKLAGRDTTMTGDTAKKSEDLPFFSESKEDTAPKNQPPALGEPEEKEDKGAAENDTGLARQDTGEEGLLDKMEDTAAQDTGQQLSPEEFRKQNPLYAILTPAINQTDEGTFARRGPVVGYAQGEDTGKVNEYLHMEKVQSVLPRDLKFYWSAKPISKEENIYELVALKVTTRDGSAPLKGDVITDARADVSRTGAYEVVLKMNSAGARTWERLTGDNIDRSIAIALDGRIYSYPTVQTEIAGGTSVITGRFDLTEAKDLANVLESGKLPMAVDIVEEAIVGPSLGEESIRAGFLSLIAGLILVMVFMIFYYNHGGLVANLALLANLYFILGVLSSLGAALTLPGIAGIVLTIGMSVDANVLIFERIREELREGKGLRLAIADGYKNSYSSIIDANLTTLLTGIILYTFGTGPIHGFAIILIIGILTSLFSAIFITRMVFEWALSRERTIKYANNLTFNTLSNTKIQFIKNRKLGYLISGIILLAGIISLSVRGLEMGVDFKGGYSYVVRFDQPVSTVDVRKNLASELNGPPEVKTFGSSNQVEITTNYLIDRTEEGTVDSVVNSLKTGLTGMKKGSFQILSQKKIGPTIAEDIRTSAIWAVIFALIVIFLYIFLRFRKWQYGLGALAAVFHDVLLIVGVFSLLRGVLPFSLEINQTFIAAILTVVGYSINDTVVVFDRIRERLSIHKRDPLLPTMNRALNDTLSRTFITSTTTIFVIIILFIFGGEVIRGFSFALLIGIFVGTYSSLFISSPIIADLQRNPGGKKKT